MTLHAATRDQALALLSLDIEEAVNTLASAPTQAEERLALVAQSTALSHEIRHFYDFIASPWMSSTFLWRIDALLYLNEFLFPILQQTTTDSVNALPIPLVLWCRMTEAERQRYLEPLRNMIRALESRELRVPDVPVISATAGSVGTTWPQLVPP